MQPSETNALAQLIIYDQRSELLPLLPKQHAQQTLVQFV